MKVSRYLNSIRSALPEEAQNYLDLAFSGDALAARRLMVMAPKRLRGHIAFLAYQLKTKNPAYREIVKAVWAHGSRHALTAHWPPQLVRRILARADFQIPKLSGPVSVFQPVSGTAARAASALTWLLSREEAITKAERDGASRPRILKATLDPSEIVYLANRPGDHEVVSRRPITLFMVEELSSASNAGGRRALHHHRVR
jgi:hypothetical protein